MFVFKYLYVVIVLDSVESSGTTFYRIPGAWRPEWDPGDLAGSFKGLADTTSSRDRPLSPHSLRIKTQDGIDPWGGANMYSQ